MTEAIIVCPQCSAERSELYGKKLISRLACELKARDLQGMSPTDLRKFREFYVNGGLDIKIVN